MKTKHNFLRFRTFPRWGVGQQKCMKIFRKGIMRGSCQICRAHILEFLIFPPVTSVGSPGQACALGRPRRAWSLCPAPGAFCEKLLDWKRQVCSHPKGTRFGGTSRLAPFLPVRALLQLAARSKSSRRQGVARPRCNYCLRSPEDCAAVQEPSEAQQDLSLDQGCTRAGDTEPGPGLPGPSGCLVW